MSYSSLFSRRFIVQPVFMPTRLHLLLFLPFLDPCGLPLTTTNMHPDSCGVWTFLYLSLDLYTINALPRHNQAAISPGLLCYGSTLVVPQYNSPVVSPAFICSAWS